MRSRTIDALNVIIYADFNLAVNLAALVTNQKDYEYYYDRIFARLDWLEERLSKQRYLMGDTITDPDIRIFPTLARFDLVFYQKYLVNKKTPRRLSKPLELRERLVLQPSIRRYNRL